ncbi:hypothetical protein M2092_000818 [Fusobacterium sp. PH5-44]
MLKKINWWWKNNILIEYYKQMEKLPFIFFDDKFIVDRKY